ncbi:AzlC family ABC transporter permease [Bacillus solimangrovi]|uniref:Branched-chain amino acid ABC transporter permease n=1 Tax=Bacillus solimangrovi TaxID=1305675 RepID=A0A1E5LEA5_9BACI|nr:AzlC family ABC transporter permease [Bacillus solimangrovi]OEH92418.1 branched-chain amino acid ABC transporter permease [Bacillus solimangrovi]
MDTALTTNTSSQFKEGFQAGVSIGIGYMPVALTFGLLAKSTGLSVIETFMMSMLVFAGASQYISLNLFAIGTTGPVIILTTFIVNIRHLLMSASLSEKIEKEHPFKKALYAFGITDETFSVAALKEGKVTSSYMAGLITVAYGSWVIFSVVGHFVGASLPDVLQESMGIALYAMFVGLLTPSLKKHRKVVTLAGGAALINIIFSFVFPPNWSGWAIVLATLSSAILVELTSYMVNKKEWK